MDTIFLGNDDKKNLVGSKLTKFCSLCIDIPKLLSPNVWSRVTKIFLVAGTKKILTKHRLKLMNIMKFPSVQFLPLNSMLKFKIKQFLCLCLSNFNC